MRGLGDVGFEEEPSDPHHQTGIGQQSVGDAVGEYAHGATRTERAYPGSGAAVSVVRPHDPQAVTGQVVGGVAGVGGGGRPDVGTEATQRDPGSRGGHGDVGPRTLQAPEEVEQEKRLVRGAHPVV